MWATKLLARSHEKPTGPRDPRIGDTITVVSACAAAGEECIINSNGNKTHLVGVALQKEVDQLVCVDLFVLLRHRGPRCFAPAPLRQHLRSPLVVILLHFLARALAPSPAAAFPPARHRLRGALGKSAQREIDREREREREREKPGQPGKQVEMCSEKEGWPTLAHRRLCLGLGL